MVKLTATNIPTFGPGEYTDGALILRVRPSGARSWCVRYRFQGRDLRFTLGKVKIKDGKGLTLKQAGDAADIILGMVAKGEDPQAAKKLERQHVKSEGVTVDDLAAEYFKRRELRPKTAVEFRRLWSVEIQPRFGGVLAPAVNRREVRLWAEKIAERAPYVANRAWEVLRRFYAFGIERDMVVATPFVGLRKPSKETASQRVLSSDELWALQRALGQLPGSSSDVVWLLLWTGVRREMVLGARREEFELGHDSKWVIPGDRTKNGKPHVVPLSKPVLKLIKERIGSGVLLFPAGQARNGRKPRGGHKAWRSAYVKSLHKKMEAQLGRDIPRWTIHNLRHTVATNLRAMGVSVEAVSMILGHTVNRGAAATRVYDHFDLMPERRDALARWPTRLERLPDPSRKVVKMKERA